MQDYSDCRGIRVFYYNAYEASLYSSKQRENEEKQEKEADETFDILSDHEHSQNFLPKRPKGIHLEAGTVTSVICHKDERGNDEFVILIRWDCGAKKSYFEKDLQNMRIFDLGPAGYKGEMVICDVCLEPVMGYAWSLANDNKLNDLYNLCCAHYNQNEDMYSECKFYYSIPSIGILAKRDRSEFQRHGCKEVFGLYGLFQDAKVVKLDETGVQDVKGGKLVRISHASGEGRNVQADLSKADHFKCCAEVMWPDADSLDFASAGCKGILDIKAVLSGKWGMIYAEHHPVLGKELFKEMIAYKNRFELKSKQCSISDGSLTIPCADLTDIPPGFNKAELECLKLVNIYKNNFEKVPDILEMASGSIVSFCGQNNFFQQFPGILFKFKSVITINLHGNCLSDLPNTFQPFKKLTRLFLGDNNLNYLPNAFDNFPLLREASFANNHLTILPDSFKSLAKLRSLNLSYNAIVRLPDPLLDGPMPELKYVDFKFNRIQKLPSRMTELKALFRKLSSIDLKGNPVCLQECLIHKSSLEVLEVLRKDEALKSLSELTLSHALRVCVLGKKEAGKTSLVKSVCYDQYVLPTTEHVHRCTVGIERHYMPLKLEGGRVIPLHIWDHAGSNEYDMVNDLFVSSGNTLVWLVVSLKEYDCSVLAFKECVQKWLHPVMRKCVNPVVWIIYTHIDKSYNDDQVKRNHIQKNIKELCKNYKECLKNSKPKNSESEEWLKSHTGVSDYLLDHMKYIPLSNTFQFKGRETLLQEMRNLASDKDTFSKLNVQLTSEWDNRIYKSIFQSASEKFGSTASSTNEVHTFNLEDLAVVGRDFLQYCHDIGEICIMKSKSSPDENRYVINFEWLISRLKMVYYWTEQQLKKCIPSKDVGQAKGIITSCGAFSQSCLQKLWISNYDDGNISRECLADLADFFIHSEIAFRFEMNSESYLFFPYLVELKESKAMDLSVANIKVECEYQFFLPRFFLQRLGLRLASKCSPYMKHLSLTQNSFEMKICKDGLCIQVFGFNTKIEIDFPESIILVVNAAQDEHLVPDERDYDILWELVVDALDIAASLIEEEPYQFKMKSIVFCPSCRENPNYLKIIKVTEEDIRQSLYREKKQCSLCKAEIPLIQLIPKSNTMLDCEAIHNVEEFEDLCSINWRIVIPKAENFSMTSYDQASESFPLPVDAST